MPDQRSPSDAPAAEPAAAAPGGTPAPPPEAEKSEVADPPAPSPTKVDIDLDEPWDPAKRPPPGIERPVTRRLLGGAAIRSGATAFADWSRRPSGRLVLPGALLFALVGMTAVAGAVVLPANAPPAAHPSPASTPSADPSLSADPGFPFPTDAVPSDPGFPPIPTGTPTTTAPGNNPPVGGAVQPADVLTGWATQIGAKVGISATAMRAYGYAELVVTQTTPSCNLSWTTVAAIGKVESGHGTANNSTLTPDGQTFPRIIGLPLDGQGNRLRIMDTDDGQLDGDSTYDRAIGPMQFIPTTWATSGVDADNNGVKDPNDLDDAALATANYLCRNSWDLNRPGDWSSAIRSYNNVDQYVRDVFAAANEYGTKSRT
ncbi:lytic transglycosylase domain-containing protein [Asanoa siamensis]|uniref:lytic transglycosylase domain-containing protein n=1 Tax=Asanoa siamensis TaxID=926357 RepID=UPI001EF19FD8|nr:lytic murein transglycosylase [Asanoa siamensis]